MSKTVESEVMGLLKDNKNDEAEKILQDFSSQCCLRTEKEYSFLHRILQDMITETGIDYLWMDFLQENCKTNDLSLYGL